MAHQIDKMSLEVLTQNLIQGTVDINALNLAKATQRDAFLAAIKQRPNLLKTVVHTFSNHFLGFAINENPEYFVYLDVDQYTNALAQTYLAKRLEKKQTANPSAAVDGGDFTVQQSLDNQLLFYYSYVTPEDSELYYFDNELQVPTSIKSSLKVSLKLVDAVRFIHKVDVNVAQLGERKLESTFMDVIVARYKSYLNEYLARNKVGYYSLCASSQDLERAFQRELEDAFSPYGIQVLQFQIKQLAIPKDIQHKIEDLSFAIRQQRANMDADAEFAQKSLDSYEKKLSLEQKYPDAQHTLTEYEKDLALKRYLIKTGRMKEEAINHAIDLTQETEVTDKVVSKKADLIPEIPMKKNVFKRTFISLASLSAFVSMMLFSTENIAAGLIALGLSFGVFGTIAAFNHKKFKNQPIEIIGGNNDVNNSEKA